MALVVGTNTYLSTTDATAYLASNYIAADTKLVAWQALSSADKDVLLRKATQIIDRLPLAGVKKTSTQALEFPRAVYSDYPNIYKEPILSNFEGMYVQSSTPQDILDAQCEIAFDLAQGTSERADLQRQGVKSFSLGKLSESYGAAKEITSYEARKLLMQYLGSVRII